MTPIESPIPLPSLLSAPLVAPGGRVVVQNDDRAVTALVQAIQQRSGLTKGEIARRLGVKVESIRPYFVGKKRPTCKWMARLVETCGGRLILELPEKSGD